MHTTTAYIELGMIKKRQGLRGSVVVKLNDDVPQFDGVSTLFVQINHTLVPYRIEKISYQHRKAIVKLQGVNDPDTALSLKGCFIFLPSEALPQLSTAHQIDNLLGYHVTDVREGALGTVQAMYTTAQQQIFSINYRGRKLLVPYHDAIVTHIDHRKQTILLHLPNGFIQAVL